MRTLSSYFNMAPRARAHDPPCFHAPTPLSAAGSDGRWRDEPLHDSSRRSLLRTHTRYVPAAARSLGLAASAPRRCRLGRPADPPVKAGAPRSSRFSARRMRTTIRHAALPVPAARRASSSSAEPPAQPRGGSSPCGVGASRVELLLTGRPAMSAACAPLSAAVGHVSVRATARALRPIGPSAGRRAETGRCRRRRAAAAGARCRLRVAARSTSRRASAVASSFFTFMKTDTASFGLSSTTKPYESTIAEEGFGPYDHDLVARRKVPARAPHVARATPRCPSCALRPRTGGSTGPSAGRARGRDRRPGTSARRAACARGSCRPTFRSHSAW